MKVMHRVGRRKTPPSPRELARRERQLGLEAAGRSPEPLSMKELVRMVVEVGSTPLRSSRAGHMRPTISGKAPHKEFLKGGLKRHQRYWPGMVTLSEIHEYPRSTGFLICKWHFLCLVHKIAQAHWVHNLHFKDHAI